MTDEPTSEQKQQQLLKQALLQLEQMQTRLQRNEAARSEPIAIVGIGCGFPRGADTPERYWELLSAGFDAVREVPADRWDADAYYDPDPDRPGTVYTRRASFLEEVDRFDAAFFGISPREAVTMDPQQRLLLEVAWQALERAGLTREKLRGSATGVYVGVMNQDYSRLDSRFESIEMHSGTGNAISAAAGRLSYFFGLNGPSMTLDTACSSSLAAVHLAVSSLRSGETDLALAGGVNLLLSPFASLVQCRAHMLSPAGVCRTFDADADGYARGEGCGVVVLKRRRDALAHGDRVHAWIRGSAMNHCGASGGLTVPSGPAQEALMRRALEVAGVEPRGICYVEAHGSGTALGDPIEIGSIGAVYGERPVDDPLWVGSVKTNVGHLEGAAGVAALIKAVLTLEHRTVPRNLHFERPNPHIPWQRLPIRVPQENVPLSDREGPLLAGVSSFGFSGTNVHVILEEAVPEAAPPPAEDRPLHVLTLAARSPEALRDYAASHQRLCESPQAPPLADLCHTANTGRTAFRRRLAVVAADSRELAARLDRWQRGEADPAVFEGHGASSPKPAFLFTGQGVHVPGMGHELYRVHAGFRRDLEEGAEMARAHLDVSLLDVLFAAGDDPSFRRTDLALPALFLLETALARLWASWGVRPGAVVGHSLGELAAACFAGVLSREDAVRLVCGRARLVQALPDDGAMMTVRGPRRRVEPLLSGDVVVAAENGPVSTVLGGTPQDLAEVAERCKEAGLGTRLLDAAQAFHSPRLDPIREDFLDLFRGMELRQPQIPLVSATTGEIAGEEIATPEYWWRQLREPVRFGAAVERLFAFGCRALVEVGPRPDLLAMIRLPQDAVCLPSLWPGREDWSVMTTSLAQAWASGVRIDWAGFDRGFDRRRVVLPTYPFQRRRYWLSVPQAGTPLPVPATADLTAAGESFAGLLYHVEWVGVPVPETGPEPAGDWLVLADRGGVGERLAERLRDAGVSVRTVFAGDAATEADAADPDALEGLVRSIPAHGDGGVVHLWGLDAATGPDVGDHELEQGQVRGVGSALSLIQALARAGGPGCVLVTRGAHPGSPARRAAPEQWPLWGLGRAALTEHPELNVRLLDLDAAAPAREAGDLLFERLTAGDSESQASLAAGDVRVPRLRPLALDGAAAPVTFDGEASYLLTGGLGGLGLAVASALVSHGVRHLVLLARHGPDARARQALQDFERQGVRVVTARVDVADFDRLAEVFDAFGTSAPPLRGVFHLAGVLDDDLLARQTWERFVGVRRAKVEGAWNLHRLSRGHPLDHFVLFSSATSLFTLPGQGNYAAANSYLDGLAHARRVEGLPALSINWGPWHDLGFTETDYGRKVEAGLGRLGIRALSREQGIAVLVRLLAGAPAQVGVLDVAWSQLLARQTTFAATPLFADLSSAENRTDEAAALLAKLDGAAPEEREGLLQEHLGRHVARILGLEEDEAVDPELSLLELGMDSLMAFELRNWVTRSLRVDLPVEALIEGASLGAVTARVLDRLAPSGTEEDTMEELLI